MQIKLLSTYFIKVEDTLLERLLEKKEPFFFRKLDLIENLKIENFNLDKKNFFFIKKNLLTK